MNSKNNFTYIAGPCSAESEEQMLDIARFLKNETPISFFRAGIWKPRTTPGGFEGNGEKALTWLQKVKTETGLKVMTEVATPTHVEACLKHEIDAVWIGARTTSNPFMVQDLAEALQGADIPVLVKNPMTPDLKLWIGAIERFQRLGITQISAIQRGFSTFSESPYRNAPLWEIPIELKRLHPEIPIICDPSHIAGKRMFLQEIAQKGLDLEMDGLMVEVHNHPEIALTDQDQQLNFADFKTFLSKLIFRQADKTNQQILQLRTIVNDIDEGLFSLLAKRMHIVEEMGLLKKRNQITILQMDRWSEVVESRLKIGKGQGLNEDFILKILEDIHEEAIRIQTQTLNDDSRS